MRRPSVWGRLCPVTMPSLADRYWISQAMTLPTTTIHTSRYPYRAPAVMLLATFPGSRYATPATKAGPSRPTRLGPPGPCTPRVPRSRAGVPTWPTVLRRSGVTTIIVRWYVHHPVVVAALGPSLGAVGVEAARSALGSVSDTVRSRTPSGWARVRWMGSRPVPDSRPRRRSGARPHAPGSVQTRAVS